MELLENGMKSVMEYYLPIYCKGKKHACSKLADIVVEDKVILEIKAVTKLKTEHEMQLVRYLKLSGILVRVSEQLLRDRHEAMVKRVNQTPYFFYPDFPRSFVMAVLPHTKK